MKRILLTLVAAVLALGASAGRAQAQDYVVVVNAANSVSSISKADLAKAFMKKNPKLTPVDLAKNSPVRDAFSKAVHGRPAAAVVSYWQQQLFGGTDVPPPEKGSDADVLAFVKSTPNGIGYVAAGTAVGAGLKTVTVE